MSLLKHYISKKLNPVPIKFKTKKDLLDHFKKRKNLVQNHLKIPELTIIKSEYLEFGCNGGENACYFAKNGANIHLVEPNKSIHKLIYKNFKKINCSKSLKRVIDSDVSKFYTKKKFDFVVAEGFLNTLEKRNKLFLKLTKFMKKKSILILNYDDIFGGIFELLKSYILLTLCEKLNYDRYSENSLTLAKKLFENEFKKINTSRSFYAWWLDQLVNPYASKTWSINDLIKLADKNKLTLYSTSPVFFDGNNLKWYKDISNYRSVSKKNNNLFYNSWKKNFLSIIFGSEEKKNSNLKTNQIQRIEKFSKEICKFISNPKRKINILPLSKTFIDFLNASSKKKLAREINLLLKYLNYDFEPKKVIKYYKNTRYLQYSWGSLLHYIAFIKE
tara:strand:+ start:1370 stop:2533 length:1164 start_codon:yes stop_codon:yes gene_type:complete